MSFVNLCARRAIGESHSLALECKMRGKFHAKNSICLKLIVDKYHEGNMKRLLKR